jgi:hypothetical protein
VGAGEDASEFTADLPLGGDDITLRVDPHADGPSVVVDAAPWNAAEHTAGVIVGVEQHLVRLLRVGSQEEGAAIRELEMSDLQLGPFAGHDRPVLRPVELESLAGGERQGHENASAGGLLLQMPGGFKSRAKAATRL